MTARTMTRDALIAALRARRDNDVRVVVPDGEHMVRLDVRSVEYDSTGDMILIETEPWWGDPREPGTGGGA